MKPIKATFLISMPRCGSYALSKIHNTRYCFAHHEGEDFDLIANPEKDYGDTCSGRCFKESKERGINYFCCDQSMGSQLCLMFAVKYRDDIRSGKIILSIISIDRDPDDVIASYLNTKVKLYCHPMSLAANICQFSTIKQKTLDPLYSAGLIDIDSEHYFNYKDIIDSVASPRFKLSFTAEVARITGSAWDWSDNLCLDRIQAASYSKHDKGKEALEENMNKVKEYISIRKEKEDKVKKGYSKNF